MTVMKFKFFILFLPLLMGCAGQLIPSVEKQDHSELIYMIEVPDPKLGGPYQVSLYFRGSDTGNSLIQLPENLNQIRDLNLVNPEYVMKNTEVMKQKRILHPPNAVIHLKFNLISKRDQPEWILKGEQPKDLFWIGESLVLFQPEWALVRPQWNPGEIKTVTIKWINLPSSWDVVSSYGLFQNQMLKISVSYDEFNRTIFSGGEMRFKPNAQLGVSWVSLKGSFRFEDEVFFKFYDEINETLNRLIKLDQDFNDLKFFQLASTSGVCCSQFSFRENEKTILWSKGIPSWTSDLRDLLTLEIALQKLDYFRSKKTTLQKQRLWGLAYYYSLESQLLLDSLSWEEFINEMNLKLKVYSQVSNPKAKALKYFFRAMELKLTKKYNSNYLLSAGSELDKNPKVDQLFTKEWKSKCASFENSVHFDYALGFDPVLTKQRGVMSGVVLGGAASHAGIRNGMRVKELSYQEGNSENKVQLRIKGPRQARWIEYFPRGKKMVIPQLVSRSNADKKECLNLFM